MSYVNEGVLTMLKETTDESFTKDVIESKELVVVDFWAEWCGPCKKLLPIMQDIADELEGKVVLYKMNINNCPDTPSKYNVRAVPTLMIFQNGEPVSIKVGVLSKNELIEWIMSYYSD